MDGWDVGLDGWTDGCRVGCWMDRWTDGQMDGCGCGWWTDRCRVGCWMDRRMDGRGGGWVDRWPDDSTRFQHPLGVLVTCCPERVYRQCDFGQTRPRGGWGGSAVLGQPSWSPQPRKIAESPWWGETSPAVLPGSPGLSSGGLSLWASLWEATGVIRGHVGGSAHCPQAACHGG